MTDPFLIPEDATAAAAIETIRDELDLFDDWMDRYAHIIDLGRKLPPFPAEWANDDHRVPGCQSQVWLEVTKRDDRLHFAGSSDAAIVAGLVALLLRVYSGRTPAEIIATDPVFLKDLGLLEALSTNRGNGIAAMARALRDVAVKEERKARGAAPGLSSFLHTNTCKSPSIASDCPLIVRPNGEAR
jgi:cysteine desulfuration protein SufE